MDFDKKKQAMMGQLAAKKRTGTLVRKNVAAKARLKNMSSVKEVSLAPVKNGTSNKPPVLVYGTKGLFFGTLKSSLAPYCDVVDFTDASKATDYIIENNIPLVVMDMDPPTDWKMCHDLFTTGKTMYPDTEYIIYQKDKNPASEVMILEKQGAHIMQKPLDRMDLIEILKEVLLNKK